MTMMKLTSIAALALFVATPAFASILGPANGYNAFVFGNANLSSDSQGALAIGGNATLTSYSLADNAPVANTNLVVGGNLTATYGTINGNALVAGNVDYNGPTVNGSITSGGNINFHNSGGSVKNGAYYTGTYTGPSYIANTHITAPISLPIDFAGAKSTLTATADALAALNSNGVTTINYGAVTFTGTNASTNVFDISVTQLAGANGITINIPTGADALINVTGSGSIALPNVGFNLNPASTLWNLDGFTTVSTSSFSGSVLAPNANVTFNSGAFYGTLVANSLTGGGQFNMSTFNYDITSTASPSVAAPEPASLSVLALGAGALLIRRKK
jgi:choice-of-anchor A domain-containing protein